jgi:hypothetical protein
MTFYMARNVATNKAHSSRAWTRPSDVTQFLQHTVTGYGRMKGEVPPWTIEVHTAGGVFLISGADWLKGLRRAPEVPSPAAYGVALDAQELT